MKACIIQPPYSRDVSFSDEYFEYKLNCLDKCDSSVDLIVLPEYSDVPCATSTLDETLFYHHKYIDILLDKCATTAKRCSAVLFVNALYKSEWGYRNTTYAFNKTGECVGKYFKKHLPPLEKEVLRLDDSYTYEIDNPYTLEIDGVRYGFLTCYDFYFYESFANIARQDVDIIIGCSLQRSDTHDAIETMCRFLAYNTNSYVVRSSVSFSEDSDICGASMIVSPFGKVICNMKGKFGMQMADIDPNEKYFKPAGFGNPDAPHYKYIEYGRKPWQYRNGGASVVAPDCDMPYSRLCAHRGFSTIAPENSMLSLGAAVALGAKEIEFDVWSTKDGVLVSCHDSSLERVSDGEGKIYDHTYEELLKLDFGINFGEKFKGFKIPTFEQILQKFSGRVIMNIHVKIWDKNMPDLMIKEIVDLVYKYDAQKHIYFMTTCDEVIKRVMDYDPDLKCCVGWDGNKDDPMSIVDRAIALGAYKVQLFKPYFNKAAIDKAHAHGILCNVFWSDDPKEAKEFLDMGIDTILTNDYYNIKTSLSID